ncbi:MAG TPA: tetratricopeptide repeat protein [Candidatus Eremiobacteraceae bacterium]|nr:tetratricopeptide repeat protein [Candidatus Eremiobacteraceae bacterium]
MNVRTFVVLAAVAVVAIAAWPAFILNQNRAMAAAPSPAPVMADYLHRDAIVAVFERDVKKNPDQLITRMLASQYLMRFRETGDIGDLLRAENVARRSLVYQPRNNVTADMTLASALLSLHRFKSAQRYARDAYAIEPWNSGAVAQVASIDVELGRYDDAQRLLRRSGEPGPEIDVALYTSQARYDELSGDISEARRLTQRAMVAVDSIVDSPAEARAWYHFRDGELAWAIGDYATAERRFNEALTIFPAYPRAYNALARMYLGQQRWHEALDAATRAADILPLPETLGYKADAQRALGDIQGARVTQDTILAIERIGNAQRVNDRALAVYYSEHGIRTADAIAIARRDVIARDDVFAEDTLAWALAQAGQWQEAQLHARRAVALDTQDARLQYHAGVIALRNGDTAEAKRRLARALELNPQFHPVYADDARRLLAQM